MRSFKTALAAVTVALLLGWAATPVCFGRGDSAEFAETSETGVIRRSSRTVLVIPDSDCQAASLILARVTRHIRDAERTALYSAAAEDEFDDGLQALIDGDCAEGIEHLRSSDKALQQSPNSELFMPPEDTR
jgi:hypothetical protein